jgi:Ca2+-binding EF-hand superfamily protein
MRYDKNGDGKLTRDEVPERMQGIFARGDSNQDGVLTVDEIRKMSQAQSQQQQQQVRGQEGGGEPGRALRESFNQMGFIMREPLYMALDTDHDGKISAGEIAAAPKSLLALDKNHDGQLTQDELLPAGPPPGGDGRPRGFGNPQEMADRLFDQFDANKDGKLTREEMPERMQELFDSADTKKRGSITRDQLVKALEARSQQQRTERQ